MSVFFLKNCRLYIAQFDLSGDTNELTGDFTVPDLDVTNFDSGGATKHIAGLEDIALSHKGFAQYGTNLVDDALFNRVAASSKPVTIVPESVPALGDRAFAFQGTHFSYQSFGTVGEVAPFSAEVKGDGADARFVRGELLHQKAAETVAGSGTARQLGSVSATQRVYGALHVFAFTGTTATIKVQSDTTGFPSPTDQITFTAVTGVTSEWKSTAGAIADDFWRYNLAGTFTSITFALAVGIR